MRKRKRFAVAYDFSEPSRLALAEAAKLARAEAAELVLLHVMPEGLTTDERRRIHDNLKGDLAEVPGGLTGVEARVRLDEGDAAPRIVDALEREQPEIALLGTHARTGVEHLVLGSVAEEVMRATRVPVLVMRMPKAGARPRPDVKVVVGIDFTPESLEARRLAETLARAHGVGVSLVHVLAASASEEEKNRVTSLLEHAAKGMRLRGVDAVPLVTWGDPATALIAETEGDPRNIIAVGTHGRGRVARWLLGSVAEPVMKRAPGAVLVAHAPEARIEEQVPVPGELKLSGVD